MMIGNVVAILGGGYTLVATVGSVMVFMFGIFLPITGTYFGEGKLKI